MMMVVVPRFSTNTSFVGSSFAIEEGGGGECVGMVQGVKWKRKKERKESVNELTANDFTIHERIDKLYWPPEYRRTRSIDRRAELVPVVVLELGGGGFI